MNRQMTGRVLALGTLLLLVLSAGAFISNNEGTVENHSQISVSACEDLDKYDFGQMLHRVEKIKGMGLGKNLTICTEQTGNGIDTTSDEKRFAYLREPGLSFFELNSPTDTEKRSSIGYTTTPLNGGPIRITLANESVVENVSWISYEALIAHELSHAIDNSHLRLDANESNRRVEVLQTTDWLLANRAVSEGTAMYVSELYVREYGGELTVSELGKGDRNWKHRILVSVYSDGYRYSKNRDITSNTEHRVNSTAQILHPEKTNDPSTLPARPHISIKSLEHVRTDRVGELFIREVLRFKGLDTDKATTATEGWANDRLDYYQGENFDVVTWRVAWQTNRDRSEFLAAYDATYKYTRVDSLKSITCEKSGRYLVTAEKTIIVVSCSD